MLSEQERRALREVQRQFEAEDPDFTRSFDEVGQRHSTYSFHWVYAMPRWAYTAAIVVAAALAMLMLVARAAGTALAFVILAMMVAAVRTRRDEHGSPT